ncbi:MAG: hypothetical protein AAF810_00630 [Cyanobacteria bacterium P01_D01_bin.36]
MTTTKSFWLKPFTPLPGPYQIDVVGRAVREGDSLTISYEIVDGLNPKVPGAATLQQARAPIWHTTHLKCFVAPVDQVSYWELTLHPESEWAECADTSPSDLDFQVSPDHDWTVLRYSDYRLNPQVDTVVSTASYSLLSTPQVLHTLLKIDLSKVISTSEPLRIGLAAVASISATQTIHWALAYPENGLDLHHPKSFTLSV